MKKFVIQILEKFLKIKILNLKARENFSRYSVLKNFFLRINSTELNKNKKFIVFDVGSNLGKEAKKYEEILIKCNFDYEFHIFEPNLHLINSIKAQNIKNVKINQLIVGNKFGKSILKIESNSEKSSVNNKIFNTNIIEELTVNNETIDGYVEKNNIKNINFIKIDTEGLNEEVIEGAKNSLEKGIIDLVLTELTLGKKYENKSEKIYNIEKYLNKNYALIGIDNQYILHFNSILFNRSFNIDLLYINKKFL